MEVLIALVIFNPVAHPDYPSVYPECCYHLSVRKEVKGNVLQIHRLT